MDDSANHKVMSSSPSTMDDSQQLPLERKHSNDPDKLVVTELLKTLGGSTASLLMEQEHVFEVEEDDNESVSEEEEQPPLSANIVLTTALHDDRGNGEPHSHSCNAKGESKTLLSDSAHVESKPSGSSSAPDPKEISDLSPLSADTGNNFKNSNGQPSKNKYSPSISSSMDDVNDLRNPNASSSQTAGKDVPQSSPSPHVAASYAQRSWWRDCLDAMNQFRYHCGMFVNNSYVELFIITLIAINAIMMGLATFDLIKNDPHLKDAFETTDTVFLVVFSVELLLQLIHHGYRLLLDGWLVFDLVIVLTSWSFAEMQIFRAFRIFRALRLVTRIKILKNLILAMIGVVPRMAAIGLMLCLIFYIFGVMFTQLFKDLYVDGFTEFNYFGSLDWTFFTLFQIMTLDEWGPIVREVTQVYKWAWLPFTLFVIISGFVVVNLIIAVICGAVGALHADEKARLHGDYDEADTDAGNYQAMDIREQLDTLEDQMEDLTRIQARTFHTLQYLTQQIEMHKIKQELQTESMTTSLSAVASNESSPSVSADPSPIRLPQSMTEDATVLVSPPPLLVDGATEMITHEQLKGVD